MAQPALRHRLDNGIAQTALPTSLVGKPLHERFGTALKDATYAPRPPMAELTTYPLFAWERRMVAERIQREVSDGAAHILRQEHETRVKLNTVHIKCISLLVLACVAVAYAMIYLRPVMVPLILAIFFLFLLEPMLFALLDPPSSVRRVCGFCVGSPNQYGPPPQPSPTANHSGVYSPASPARRFIGGEPESEASWGSEDKGRRLPDLSLSGGDNNLNADGFTDSCGGNTRAFLAAQWWKAWRILSVLACLLMLLSLVAAVIFYIVQAIAGVNWRKYAESRKMQLVLSWFPQLQAKDSDLDTPLIERVLPLLMQGPVFSAIDWTFSLITQAFLTILFLAFLLFNDAVSVHAKDASGIGKKIRMSMRRYIRIKTAMACLVAVLCGLLYWWTEVDLFFLFAVATFVLCYIPHVGNTIAIIAPLPLVFLDPDKTWGDLCLIFVAPFIIHQLVTNLLEPKLLASSLDLHPIIVLLSLAFWSTVWGAVGAILSVPLTAVTRMILLEVEHPYARPIVNFLKGNLDPGSSAGKEAKTAAAALPPLGKELGPEKGPPAERSPCGGFSPVPGLEARPNTPLASAWSSSPFAGVDSGIDAFEGDGGLPSIRGSGPAVTIVGSPPLRAICA